jgi:secreted Zn-dependent insulinase-like peptidase
MTQSQALLAQMRSANCRVLFICDPNDFPFLPGPLAHTQYYQTPYQISPLSLSSASSHAVSHEPLLRDAHLVFYFLNPLLQERSVSPSDQPVTTTAMPPTYTSGEMFHAVYHKHAAQLVECYIGINQAEPLHPEQKRVLKAMLHLYRENSAYIHYCASCIGGQTRVYVTQTGLTLHFRLPKSMLTQLLKHTLAQLTTPLVAHCEAHHWTQLLATQSTPKTARAASKQVDHCALELLANAFVQAKNEAAAASRDHAVETVNSTPQVNLSPSSAQQCIDIFMQHATTECLIYGDYDNPELARWQRLISHYYPALKPSIVGELQPEPLAYPTKLTTTVEGKLHYTGILLFDQTCDAESYALWMLLGLLNQGPFFQATRQQSQLGYDCGAAYITHQQKPGMLLYLVHEHPHTKIEQHIRDYLAYVRAELEADDVRGAIPHLLSSLQPPQDGFSLRANYYWMLLGKPSGIAFLQDVEQALWRLSEPDGLAYLIDKLDPDTQAHIWVNVSGEADSSSLS